MRFRSSGLKVSVLGLGLGLGLLLVGCPPAAEVRPDPVVPPGGPAKEPLPEVCADAVLMAPLPSGAGGYGRAFARYSHLEELYKKKITDRDLDGAYSTLIRLGRLSLRRLRKPDVAMVHFAEARALATQMGDASKEAEALLYTGQAQIRRTQYQDAVKSLEQTVALYKKLNKPIAEAQAMATLSRAHHHLKNTQKAMGLLGQADNMVRPIKSEDRLVRMALGRTLMAIGSARNLMGDDRRAEDAYQQALAAFVSSSDFPEQARALEEIGEIHEKAGRHERAAAYFQEAYAAWSKLGDYDGQADALLDLGDELLALSQKDLALDAFIKARAFYEKVGQEADSSAALGRMGKAYAALGNKPQAFASFFQAMSLARASNRPARLAQVLEEVSTTYASMGEYEQAVRCSQRAFQFWQEMGEQDDAARALIGVGDLYVKLGDLRGARDNYDRALGICRALSDLSCEATVRKKLDLSH